MGELMLTTEAASAAPVALQTDDANQGKKKGCC
jgi:hypothetical protein